MRFYCTSTGPIGGLNCEVLLLSLNIHSEMFAMNTYVHTCYTNIHTCTWNRVKWTGDILTMLHTLLVRYLIYVTLLVRYLFYVTLQVSHLCQPSLLEYVSQALSSKVERTGRRAASDHW